MNSFFAVLIALSILGFIVLEAITLYNKVTHQMLFHVPTTKYKSYILGTVLLFCVAIFGFQFTNPQPVTSAHLSKEFTKQKRLAKKNWSLLNYGPMRSQKYHPRSLLNQIQLRICQIRLNRLKKHLHSQ